MNVQYIVAAYMEALVRSRELDAELLRRQD